MEKTKILVVDDVPAMRESCARLMRQAGYEVLTAGTGEETLRLAASEKPDLILLDVNLPDMDGREVCSRLKADPDLRSIFVVHMSATYVTTESQAEGLEAGADGYITLPLGNRELLARVRSLVRIQQAERAVRKLNQELEQRVRERTAALEAAVRELEGFCYSVAHDLRAPLRAIEGFAALLSEEYGQRLDAQGLDYLLRIRRGAVRLANLIDALLDLSRIARLPIERRLVDLSAMAGAIAADLQKGHPDRAVEFVVHPDLKAMADFTLLKIALENLLSNAWKATQKQDQPKVEFGATPHEGKTAYFVRDNGVGFDMAYATKLFRPFQTLHSAGDFPESGIGMGLVRVERIIQRHGGQVWAEGQVGKGATFYFTLP